MAVIEQPDAVQVWEESVVIPTYGIGVPEKNPMFLEKRVYQGSSGVVYPLPVIESVTDEKADRSYTALFLENRYLKIMILPELGGRVQMALDKTNGYHFVYYNRVIKPALVGLAGPWISGGIEFNWPQHHRPSTFSPVDYHIEVHEDGSKTVWCSEIERMFRTKGMAGFRLYPDRAYLEIDVRLYNRTTEPQTFLWWANPAVKVNDDYQSIFPPDVHAVMDHGKRDVSDFPIATGTYYKVDYSPGTDISRYKNIPVPTSFMAYHSDFDFIGCYDHGARAGMMHVANHHVVPGKKQWTWGNGDFGHAWDRQLTDEDGPYIELMCGAYTDNQPDFSWLMPGEEKRFTQVFMPYKHIGGAKNASSDVVLNLDVNDGKAKVGVYATSSRTVTVQLHHGAACLYEQTAEISPEKVLLADVTLGESVRPQELTLGVYADGRLLLSYTPLPSEKPPIPEPATAAPPPAEVASNEELFLHGLHLEQYRHATYAPEPYYEEALRRDSLDSRCNNAMGLLLFRRGKFAEAEPYLRRAIERLTMRNPNPYDGEPFYNLGLSLKMQGRYDEAYAAFYKAVWNSAWQHAAFFELARIACRRGDFEETLDLTERSLARNTYHHQARHLKIAVLRRMGRAEEALQEISRALELDRLDFGALYEQKCLQHTDTFDRHIREYVHNYIEVALDYAHAGLFEEAASVLDEAPVTDPMVKYYRGWVALQDGNLEAARVIFEEAATLPPDYCFPHRIECVLALGSAIEINPKDARAPYYLGNFWYAHRRYDEAIASWEQARALDPSFPTVFRNLGLAYMNKLGDSEAALVSYERAFALAPTDARVFFELDQLLKKLGQSPSERLGRLEQHLELVEQRDDLMVEYIALLNLLGRHEEALYLLTNRMFHPWEGGEGKVTGQYVTSLVELSRKKLAEAGWQEAIDLLTRARRYPANLGEGKLYIAQENHIFYYLGCAFRGLGDHTEANAWFEKASRGLSEPSTPMYYNDQPPETIFYQGLAWRELGFPERAEEIFRKLVEYGKQHLEDEARMDYFAVSLPDFLVFDDDLERKNRIHCLFMTALGYAGLGEPGEAEKHLNAVLSFVPDHQGAALHLRNLDDFVVPAGGEGV